MKFFLEELFLKETVHTMNPRVLLKAKAKRFIILNAYISKRVDLNFNFAYISPSHLVAVKHRNYEYTFAE